MNKINNGEKINRSAKNTATAHTLDRCGALKESIIEKLKNKIHKIFKIN